MYQITPTNEQKRAIALARLANARHLAEEAADDLQHAQTKLLAEYAAVVREIRPYGYDLDPNDRRYIARAAGYDVCELDDVAGLEENDNE
jgi:hypothetical protein